MKPSHTIRPVFDDPNLVSAAGLVPALRLAESAGLYDFLDDLTVPSPNTGAKTPSVIGGMLAGADSIDDLDLLRHGGMGRLFDGVRAPSTLGTFLRTFTHGHVQQLDKAGGRLLAGLATRVPGLVAGADADGVAFLDIDDTIGQVHGYAKQGAAFGYSGVRGLNVQLATISTPLTAPVIARARLRAGNTASAAGAGRLLADAWTPIAYPNAVYDEAEDRWVSDAEVAEIGFTAFTGRRKACRLVVRRVKRLQPLAGDGTEQGELFATYRHHAFITNSTLGLIEADQRHRDHATIEQVIAELKNGPLAHLPSGKYPANAAWVAHAVIAFNIARAAALATDQPRVRWATLRARIINVPARIASTGRRLVLHLPTHWPWASNWKSLWSTATATGPPAAPAT